ncbi:MAG: SMI1/KNR4 family protein [Planctomycetaceae bacterium]
MSDIASLWNELEELLATIAPTVLPTLNPPATDCDLDLLESKTGLILPQDFRQSLKIHNGQSDPSRLELLTEHGILLSCEEIAEAWRMLCEILDEVNQLRTDPIGGTRAFCRLRTTKAIIFAST